MSEVTTVPLPAWATIIVTAIVSIAGVVGPILAYLANKNAKRNAHQLETSNGETIGELASKMPDLISDLDTRLLDVEMKVATFIGRDRVVNKLLQTHAQVLASLPLMEAAVPLPRRSSPRTKPRGKTKPKPTKRRR